MLAFLDIFSSLAHVLANPCQYGTLTHSVSHSQAARHSIRIAKHFIGQSANYWNRAQIIILLEISKIYSKKHGPFFYSHFSFSLLWGNFEMSRVIRNLERFFFINFTFIMKESLNTIEVSETIWSMIQTKKWWTNNRVYSGR